LRLLSLWPRRGFGWRSAADLTMPAGGRVLQFDQGDEGIGPKSKTSPIEYGGKLIMRRIICEVEKCLGCKSCEIACAVAHSTSKDLPVAIAEATRPAYRVMVEYVEQMSVPLQCRHCEDAPCVRVCPTHALSKLEPDGIVLQQPERCIGCTWCVAVCPFGAIRMRDLDKAILKCDLCIERQREGKDPACVEACPTHALRFKSVEEISKDKRLSAIREFLLGRMEPGAVEATVEPR